MSLRSEMSGFAGFLLGLPSFLSRRVSLADAREIVLRRMREREANFLTLVERAIFANTRSPYRQMFELAGCELGDLRRLLRTEGLDDTLRLLRAAGVYVSFDEFKGQRAIERGGRIIPARPQDFDNPLLGQYHEVATGGSTGASRQVRMDLDSLAARLPLIRLGDEFHHLQGIPIALWFEIPPGNGLDSVLQRVPTGNIPERWFTPIRGGRDGIGLRFRLGTRAIIAVARRSGAPVPGPEHVPLERAHVIAEWAADALRRHGACGIRTHVSKALRVCLAARERGIDLTGAVISMGGEPPTPAKVGQIRSTGARAVANYHITEAGPVGLNCTTSSDPNDQHLLLDHLALVQAPRELPGFQVTVPSFHLTTLLPTAAKVLLNVEFDDYGILESRSCGCPFEDLGFTTHLRDIRSFTKLTGEGVTLVGTDMERILEEELPGRFGGTHLDYQILEEEDGEGFTRLTILVDPVLHIPDEQSVIDTVLVGLRRRGGAAEISGAIWSQANTLRVRRESPRLTPRGKWLPLAIARRAAVADPGAVYPIDQRPVHRSAP